MKFLFAQLNTNPVQDIGEKGIIADRYCGDVEITKLSGHISKVEPLQWDVYKPFNLFAGIGRDTHETKDNSYRRK